MQYTRTKIIPMFEGFCRRSEIDGKEIVATISGTKVNLRVAANEDTKAKGLMGSDEPKDNNGMLFVYDIPDHLGFWMKNVNYPLDILFFDENLEIVDRHTMDPYNGESNEDIKVYYSRTKAMYAVELRAGWYNENIDLNKGPFKLKF